MDGFQRLANQAMPYLERLDASLRDGADGAVSEAKTFLIGVIETSDEKRLRVILRPMLEAVRNSAATGDPNIRPEIQE